MIHDTIKQRLRASLLGAASGKEVLDTASHLAGELNEAGCWRELDDSPSGDPEAQKRRHLTRTMQLAKAQHLVPGELGGATRLAFDWWLSHDFRSSDWYQDQITVPRLVGEIALLCEDDLSLGAWGRIIEVLTRSRWSHWSPGKGWTEWTGPPVLGVAYNVILRGCLENAPTLCEGAFRRAFRKVDWFSGGREPAQASMFADPGPPSAGNLARMRDYARLITLAYGTPWQAPTESTKAFVAYLLDHQQWMLWRDLPDGERSAEQDSLGLSGSIAQLAQLGNPPRRAELANMAERLDGRGVPLSGHRYFPRSLFTVHQRPEFYCSLALPSPRPEELAAPARSQEALPGVLRILRTGREYTGLADRTQAAVPEASPAHQEAFSFPRAAAPFAEMIRVAGGVGDGEYGLAASGVSTATVAANKAWFFFDRSVVCLETAIAARGATGSLLSHLNRCRLDGPVVAAGKRGASRHPLAPGQRHSLSGVHRIEHAGFLYYFPDSLRLMVDLEDSADQEPPRFPGSQSIFTVGIDHGIQPQDAASACFVLPLGDGPSQAGLEAEIDGIEVLANRRGVQAVRHRGLGIISVAFWEPSVLALPGGGRIAANSPCLLLSREASRGSIVVNVSNLLRRAAVVHVECHDHCVCFALPGGVDAGRSFSRRL